MNEISNRVERAASCFTLAIPLLFVCLLASLAGCDSGYGKTMTFKLSALTGTNRVVQAAGVVTQAVAIVGEVAAKHGFTMDQQTLEKAHMVGDGVLLCFYVRGSESGQGRLILSARFNTTNSTVEVSVGKFHTSERERLVENVYSELKLRLAKENGLKIEP